MRRLLGFIGVLSGLIFADVTLADADTESRPVVELNSGKLLGLQSSGTYSFKGIPYAAPPVGERRWLPPSPPEAWEGERDATAFGAACLQTPYAPGSPYAHKLDAVSEDCLTLNVWTTHLGNLEKQPVMVWIHGGAFTRGASSLPSYDGTVLARRGVVLVSINYRLNVFGNLAHPLLTKEQGATSGNYGLQDQIAALEWVQANIEKFGGDPSRVTIFGESAGSSAVNQLLASPRASGLFAQAIGQSGGYLSPQDTLADGHAVGEQWWDAVGVDSLEALRALPAAEVTAQFEAFEKAGKRIRPLVDGTYIPEAPLALFKRGDYNTVPSLVGYNKDESTAFALYPSIPFLFKSQEAFEKGLKDFMGVAAYPFFWAYPEQEGSVQPYLDFWRDLIFGWNMHTWARLNENAGQPSWLYFFTHVPNNDAGKKLGAYHAAEIAYVFGNGVPAHAADQRVHQLLQTYWVNFAKTGDPNGKGVPAWPRYGSDKAYMELQETPSAGEALDSLQMKLWSVAYNR